ncbi:hypothetical protein OM076_14495 [Solirubrobacter ginsenosidimutans]|uniref:Photosynthesis system II assembly factor Ycf48/Hcf136-like domain-containing protein n=1 Tax=Solirubrobacter ginsenosidimutans TaxID=490573 RepID=A0A9X3MU55_9ACTN|nr:hypothetical protein [Solirubrobacter ginsenosidimutans]MDA0161482.1 hypothetical protein [Solirubrobacter ginsenosidimutans]
MGTFAALSLAAACASTAGAAVQVSQSGWQWGNPTPQGNTIRAMDFIAGRGYAIGDDGTALRTDDGGATWAGLATGTSQDLTRLQAVTPDVVVILGGDGCVVRRSDDGGATFHKMFVLAETNCPDRVAASFFVTPEVGYLLLRDGNVLRTTDGGATFGRGTAIPGTPASAAGGQGTPADAIFTTPDAGIVFLNGTSTAYKTTDDGASWTPVPAVDPGAVTRMHAISPTAFYAFGPDTLLRSSDGGVSWQKRPGSAGSNITGLGCSTDDVCLLSTAAGDKLLRTEDGGTTSTPVTASTAPIYAAGFANPARAVALGAGGATVISDDSGKNYAPIGGDISGSFQFGLRLGPAPEIALALGARGQLARTTDNGVTWKAINVATSADMQDTSFTTADSGYALDQRGGLFKTANGGASWQPIDPGTTSAPKAVIATGNNVLLAGPRGIRRAAEGGEFSLISTKPVRGIAVDQFDRGGSAIFAYGSKTIVRTTNGGKAWTQVKGPSRKSGKKTVPLALRDVDMTSGTGGYALDTGGRVWRTSNGGKKWTELPSVGTDSGLALAFGSATSGYLTLGGYPADTGVAYVLRTTDSGKHWRPQRIASGQFPGTEGVISPSATRSYALTSTPAAGDNIVRSLFTTGTGGDAGGASTLSLTTNTKKVAKKVRKITVQGALKGAQGGEAIVVSARKAGSSSWKEQVVTAGANGGRFTASFNISGPAEFVARWAGDSGRQGAGSSVLSVTVKK